MSRLPTIVAPANDAEDTDDVGREIEFWTTRDGREIPLDEMTDEHVANALRVLTVWRARLVKQGSEAPILDHLATAIARFKEIDRSRRRAQRKSSRLRDR
jgi:G:T-mismatch repair DNA endonuclease (very short patch repair protein)